MNISVSLDGYVAGPDQSEDDPIGEGGMQLHEWIFQLQAWRKSHGREGGEVSPSTAVVEETQANVGAGIMGRGMFGGGPGPWGEDPWNGWWGDDPPFHVPVYVLTHHERKELEFENGTIFHFHTDGIESALERAGQDAGDKDIVLGGGANAAQQYIAAGLLDELELNVVPVLLGAGERLLDNLDAAAVGLEQVRVIEAPGVTHVKYRLGR